MKHWFCNYIYHPERARENEVAHNEFNTRRFQAKKKATNGINELCQNDSFINNSYLQLSPS
jgi:hypothetical protein